MMKRGIVNVRMVITEEKILSNVEKIHKLINPNNKKQIIELEDNSYFKDLVESVKTYLIEYPKKKNFPKNVYDQCYELVEYATKQFEENTKQIEDLIKEREYNIKSAAILKQTKEIVESGDPNWKQSVKAIQPRFSRDIIQSLSLIATVKEKDPENYNAAVKLVNARIDNLQSNLHIEIDMERIEDRSRALSFIGIEIADALKQIPVPRGVEESDSSVVENAQENLHIEEKEVKQEQVQASTPVSPVNTQVQNAQVQNNAQNQQQVQQQVQQQNLQAQQIAAQRQMQQRQAFYNNMYANQMRQAQYQYAQYRQNMNARVAMPQQARTPSAQYMASYYNPRQNRQVNQQMNVRQQVQKVQARPEAVQQVDYTSRVYQNAKEIEDGRNIKVKSSLWNRFMNSKFVKSIKYAFKLRVVLQLPEGEEATANNK